MNDIINMIDIYYWPILKLITTPKVYNDAFDSRNGNVTEYTYSAEGVKLKTIHRTAVSGLNIANGSQHILTPSETLSVDSTLYVGNFEIDGNYCSKYYFANGYIDMGNTGSGTYHYTITDHLGNVRAVVDENGTLKQVNNYFAYGGLLNDVTTGADVQTHKYNGKELDRMHGLDMYDYGARNYDAALGQFTTMDPLCEKYYHISPYAYCFNNPIRLVDMTGKEPTAKEAAYIADHVYGKTKELIGGWQLYYRNSSDNGLQYGIYQREKKGGELEYVLAFAGTNDIKDVQQDLAQFLGSGDASQYGNAVNLGKDFASLYVGYEKTLVGHSLGGGLATAASMSSGIPAITFNPAAMTEYTKEQLGIQNVPSICVTNYVVVGDPLSMFQNKMGLSLPGNTNYIYTKNFHTSPLLNSYDAHRISTIKHLLP